MQKQSDINDILSTIGSKAQGAGSSLSSWYGGLNPEVKRTLMQGLVGAGTGAALTGGLAMAGNKKDPEHGPRVRSQALMGALLGGVAGVGIPAGLKLLGGGTAFQGEDRKSLIGRGGNALVEGVIRHPVLTAGTVGASMVPMNRMAYEQFGDAFRSTKHRGVRKGAIKNAPHSVPSLKSLSGTSGAPAGQISQIGTRLRLALRRMAQNRDISAATVDSGVASPKLIRQISPHIKEKLDAGKSVAGKVKPGAEAIAKALKSLASRRGVGTSGVAGPLRLAAIPAAAGAGWLADKYLRGDY